MKENLPQKTTAQLKSADKGGGGSSMMPPAFGLTASPVQMMKEKPPGRGQCNEIGDFWIVPDSTTQCYVGVIGEQITETEYAKLMAVWSKLKDGSGNIKITEKDSTGTDHSGFQAEILAHMAKLLAKPVGRGLVTNLVNGATAVTIRPSSSQIYGGGNAIRGGSGTLENTDGTAGSGGTTIIQIDPGLKDSDVVVYDKDGNEINLPVFITLGHELIHAQHNSEGRNRRNNTASDTSYSNQEEEETIATGGLTENDLRTEHGMTLRHGHAGRDTR